MEDIYKQASKIIEILEKDCEVYDLKINNIPIWWFVREGFYEETLNYLDEHNKDRDFLSAVRPQIYKPVEFKLVNIIYFLLRSLKSLIEVYILKKDIKKPILFLTASRGFVKGKHFDVYIDEIYEKLSDQSLVVARPTFKNQDAHVLAYCQGVIFFDFALLLATFGKISELIFPAKQIKNWEKFENKCKKTNFGRVSSDWLMIIIKKLFLASYRKNIIQLKAADLLLEKINPMVIIETASYDAGVMALNFAAKKRKIPVIEIQHGCVTRDHPAYNYFLPQDYLEKPPLPDKILVHGEVAKREILGLGNAFGPADIVITGFSRLNSFLDKIKGKRSDIRKELREKFNVNDTDFFVLITDQLGEHIARFIESSLPLLPKKFILMIKPHPLAMDKAKLTYKNILSGQPRIRIITDKNTDLYELLLASDVHATVYSTAFLEAMALSVPNIIIKGPHYNMALNIIYPETIEVVGTPNEFVEVLKKLRDNYEYKKDIMARGYVLAQNFFDLDKQPIKIMLEEIGKYL